MKAKKSQQTYYKDIKSFRGIQKGQYDYTVSMLGLELKSGSIALSGNTKLGDNMYFKNMSVKDNVYSLNDLKYKDWSDCRITCMLSLGLDFITYSEAMVA